MIDCTLNGFVNIIYVSLAGAIIGVKPTQLGVGVAGAGEVNTMARQKDGISSTSRIAIPARHSISSVNGGLSQHALSDASETFGAAVSLPNIGTGVKI